MKKRTLISTVSALVLAASVSGGCSVGGGTQSGDDAGKNDADGDYVPGPLDEYFEVLWGTDESTQAFYDEQDRAREELVAQCMAEEGFEYIPNTMSTTTVVEVTEEETDGPDWGSREFAEQYGYGIVRWPGMDSSDGMEESSVEDEYVDPNEDYIMSLSESEQTAFYDTLYGPSPTEEEMEDPDFDWENGWVDSGCYGWAQQQVEQDSTEQIWTDPEFEDLMAAMEQMYTDIEEANSDIIELNANWASCMSDAGFPGLTGRSQGQELLYEDFNDLMSNKADESGSLPQSELDAFHEKEVERAVADWDCSESVDFDKRTSEIYLQEQQRFVDQWRTQLDAMVAKYGSDKE